MNEVLGAVLGIRLTLQGMDAVLRGVTTVGKQLAVTKTIADNAASGFRTLATSAALIMGALFKAGEDETMRLSLTAIEHSGALALEQLRYIRSESAKGLFDKEDLFQTVKLLDLSHASLAKFLPLTEEIALRSGKSLKAVAQYMGELAGGGTARLQGLLKPAGITVDQLKAAGLNINEHYKTDDSAAKIIAALQKVTGQNSLSGALGGSFMAAYKGDLADIVDLLRSIGDGLLPIATPVLQFLGEMIKAITLLNDLTHGWMSNIVLAISGFLALTKVLPLIEKLVGLEKLAVFWGTIWKVLNGGWSTWLQYLRFFVETYKDLVFVLKTAVFWEGLFGVIQQIIRDNWVGALVIAGLAGIAWAGSRAYAGNDGAPGDASGESGADRPQRRSSWENIYRKRQGFMMGA